MLHGQLLGTVDAAEWWCWCRSSDQVRLMRRMSFQRVKVVKGAFDDWYVAVVVVVR